MAPDRTTIDRMLREQAPAAIRALQSYIDNPPYDCEADSARVRVEAAEALLRALALFPDPYARPTDLRRALDE